MTIRPPGLNENLKVLEEAAVAALRATKDGTGAPEGFDGLSAAQVQAIQDAILGNNLSIEVVVGPTTRLGAEMAPGTSVLRDLRSDIKAARGGADVLLGGGGATDAERIEPTFAEAAATQEARER